MINRTGTLLVACLVLSSILAVGAPSSSASATNRTTSVASSVSSEAEQNILLWKADLLPGELQHDGIRQELVDIFAMDLNSMRQRAPADLAAYTVLAANDGLQLVPTADLEQEDSDDVAAVVPHMYGYTITTNDLREIGDPIYKRASCYRKSSWSGGQMRHDICYWKYRIDENSLNYDYWLYGNELTATTTKTHRGVPDPYISWAKVAQQLGWEYRRDYMIFGRFDTVKTHAPRGSHYGNCQTIEVSSSISAEARGASGTVGIAAPLEICSRITEFLNPENTYKRATYVHEDNFWGSNRRKTATIVAQTIIKLKQRPYGSWQPYWSDTAQTRVNCWDQWPCRGRTF